MEPLKLGVIGGGINSAVGNTHFIASQMDNRWKIVAGCFSRNKNINEETAAFHQINNDHVYDNWIDLLENEKDCLDALCILTPTTEHYPVLMEAIRLGYPIICEKALVADTKQLEDIKNLLEEKNGFLAVTYNYTGYPMVRELRKMIADGELGDIQQVNIEMPQEGYLKIDKSGYPSTPQEWRLHDKTVPVISLDLGTHLHNMVYFLTQSNPIELICTERSLGNFDVIDDVKILAEYTNNLTVNMWYSKAAIGYRNGLRIRVFGTNASTEWYQMNPEELIINYNDGRRAILDRASLVSEASRTRYNRFKAGHPSGFIEAFANYYSDIADSLIAKIKGNKIKNDYVFGVECASEGLKMLEFANHSAVEKRWKRVNTNEKNSHFTV
ncbi:Gfo/Idh/MocA family oxidoreductase [Bacillaceae bacterium CLA-AA-H227]|uniref:Gfo/Idh/MocA family oxidoreductase n=1 Tax=Robertmurraya yapensis (ex Hitch et al 2024) TaxID=3133160 RepID=A0ACC6SEL4_9BACI